jgi:predicted RNA-binding protein
MKGYEILEQQHLNFYREDGIVPYDTKIGLLDFLRELNSGPESISKHSSFMVVGIDDVLYLTKKDKRHVIARDIRKILQSAANELERKINEVQIVCKGKLVRGDSLWVEYRGEKLQIDYIFGAPLTREIRGFRVYTAGFNLSS